MYISNNAQNSQKGRYRRGGAYNYICVYIYIHTHIYIYIYIYTDINPEKLFRTVTSQAVGGIMLRNSFTTRASSAKKSRSARDIGGLNLGSNLEVMNT